MTTDQRDTIIDLLQNVGSRKEINQYLKAFQSVETTRFAVIKVGGGLLMDEIDELASTLAFLSRIGLLPIVVHGAGPQLTTALRDMSIEPKFIAGSRVTTPEVLAAARRVFQKQALLLSEALEIRGARARPIVSGVFEAMRTTDTSMGWVGEVIGVDLSLVNSAIASGQIPVVSSLASTAQGQTLNINADVAARELARAVEPRKIIFLTPTSGLLNENGDIIPAVNLEEDFESLLSAPWIDGGMALKLREIKRLLDQMPATSSVAITSPGHLVRELFTHNGHGTLIQRGVRITERPNLNCVDVPRLTELLESSFQKTLARNYFERTSIDRIFLANDYSAAAIIAKFCDAHYLDKYAVSPEVQGSGIGASLWARLTKFAPSLFWRADRTNPIVHWYFERADGAERCGDWIMFWRGMRDRAQIQECVEYASSLDRTLNSAVMQEPQSEGGGHVLEVCQCPGE